MFLFKRPSKSYQNLFIIGQIILFGILFTGCTRSDEKIKRETIDFNKDWKFSKQSSENEKLLHKSNYQDRNWEKVSIPHTANIEPLVIKDQQWQGNSWYRKNFLISSEYKGKHLALYFEGAMHTAEVWLNDKKVAKHIGGYLPFYIDISEYIYFDKENVIAIKLDNKDKEEVPPGKAMDGLDFNYYGGLYRNVRLIVKEKIHITNPIQTNIISGGGIFIRTKEILDTLAIVNVKADILNSSTSPESIQIKSSIYDASGNLVKSISSESKQIMSQHSASFDFDLNINSPELWSPESPEMYTLLIDLVQNKKTIDSDSTRFGIRSIQFDKNGFFLNGEKYNIRGTNRHQEYPYIGYALSDNAQYRDAYKIKKAGFNFVRLSHYPHSESFMDACDELGILVMDAIPGWQFFGNAEFQENCYNDIRQMVRRDRNHPSVILWEASLNESAMTEDFMDKANKIVHEEFPGSGVYTCGWMDYAFDVFIPARQHAKPPHYWKQYKKDKPLLIAEYGDWEYYAQNAGFNQKSFSDLKENERTSRQLRGDGQVRLAQQALNYQESHNDNLYNSAAGDANWLMFDYNRGYAPDIESSGVMDIFRLPKFAYHFYRSQKDLATKDTVLFIANYWNDHNFNDVKIYSNCDEVALFLNDELIDRKKPDKGINSFNLKHPPFTFENIKYAEGELIAKGYVNNKLVISTSRKTFGNPSKIEITIDESNKKLEANCNDVAFVYAKIIDENGTYIPTASNAVKFSIEGDAQLIGDNPMVSEAGIASIILKVGQKAGEIKITCSSKDLKSETLTLNIK